MGRLDRTGQYDYTDDTKAQHRVSNRSRPAISGRVRGRPIPFIDLEDSNLNIRKQFPIMLSKALQQIDW